MIFERKNDNQKFSLINNGYSDKFWCIKKKRVLQFKVSW